MQSSIANPVAAFLPGQYQGRYSDFYIYGLEWNTLVSNATTPGAQPQTFSVDADSDFLCTGLSYVEATSGTGGAEQTYAPILVNITDTSSGNGWFGRNALMHLQNVFGRLGITGTGINRLDYPRLIPAATQVTVELTNLEANARRVWVAFHGVKISRRIAV